MNSNISNEQVCSLYENGEGALTVEELAEMFNVRPAAIKMALLAGSRKYREKLKKSDGEHFGDEDFETSKQVLRSLMINADSDVVKLRAAQLVFDEKTGKRTPKNMQQNINFNMTLINQELAQVEKAIEKAKAKVVDIDPKHQHLKELTLV